MSLSITVLYELAARPIEETVFQEYETWRKHYKESGKLIVPTADDWTVCYKAVRDLRLAEKKRHKGKTPAMLNATAFQNDALIARSAFKANCFVVTNNFNDYNELRKAMRFDFMTAREYFGL